MMQEPKKIYLNALYENFLKIIKSIDISRRKKINAMFDDIGVKFFTTPASTNISFHSCFPGGLIHHTLYVIKNMVKLIDTFQISDFSKQSLIIVSMFHDLGKVGDGIDDYYIPNDSDYWKGRGYIYRVNDKFEKVQPNTLSLMLLQKYQIPLNYEEFNTIFSFSNKNFTFKDNELLLLLLQWSDLWSIYEEKREKIELIRKEDDAPFIVSDGKMISGKEIEKKNVEVKMLNELDDGKISTEEIKDGLEHKNIGTQDS